MKILYISDLHGSLPLYNELTSKIHSNNIDALIIGGDLLPRKGHDINSLVQQKDFIQNEFSDFLHSIHSLLNHHVYIIFGNNDWAETLPLLYGLEEDGLCTILHDNKVSLLENVDLIGYPYIPPSPFPPKDFEKLDYPNEKISIESSISFISQNNDIRLIDPQNYFHKISSIKEDLEFIDKPDKEKISIYIMHSPPYDTFLDRLYNSRPRGSRAIKEFIEKFQPTLTLHGHIHESPVVTKQFWQKIGNTISVNPGQTGGVLCAVIFDPLNIEGTLEHTIYGRQSLQSVDL